MEFKIEDVPLLPFNSQDLDLQNLVTEELLAEVENYNYEFVSTDLHAEETLDVRDVKSNPPIEFTPVSPRGPPEKKNESDKCNFAVEIDGSLTQKKKFLYSHQLNRIYVPMGCNFSVNFNWEVSKVPAGAMYVRATVVFSHPEQAEKRVERCLQHAHVSSNAETQEEVVVKNVLRSAREFRDPNVYYCGSPTETDCWYSVLVQFNGPTGHAYHFVCKNSCSSGINRRAIDVIFTLEDSYGNVYGRQSVGTRVCSAPRRDMNQQEKEFMAAGGKRPAAPKEKPAKKIKLEVVNNDNAVVTLPRMDIVGPRAMIAGLRVMYNMMEQTRSLNLTHQQPVDELDRCIANIKKNIDDLESKYKINTA